MTSASQRSWVRIPFKPEFFFRLSFRNCLSCVVTARIFLLFDLSSAVQIYVSYIYIHLIKFFSSRSLLPFLCKPYEQTFFCFIHQHGGNTNHLYVSNYTRTTSGNFSPIKYNPRKYGSNCSSYLCPNELRCFWKLSNR